MDSIHCSSASFRDRLAQASLQEINNFCMASEQVVANYGTLGSAAGSWEVLAWQAQNNSATLDHIMSGQIPMDDVTVLAINAIVSNPKIRSGRPIIVGTTLRVQDVVAAHRFRGYPPEEIAHQYPTITLAQVYAALAYYYEHQAAIDRQMDEDEQFARDAKEKGLGQRHPPILR